MVLQDWLVIVDDGQVRGGLDVEIICGARVIIVMYDGRHQQWEDLQIRHPVLESSLGYDPVSALKNICSVQVVVVRVAMTENIYY